MGQRFILGGFFALFAPSRQNSSLVSRHAASRHAMAMIRRVSDWPRSRFLVRGPGWPACPQPAKRGTIRSVVRDTRPKMAVNGSRWQFLGRRSRLVSHPTVPPTCGELLGNTSEPDRSLAGRARLWRNSRVGCASCHSDQTSSTPVIRLKSIGRCLPEGID